jgi:hypothetical protein
MLEEHCIDWISIAPVKQVRKLSVIAVRIVSCTLHQPEDGSRRNAAELATRPYQTAASAAHYGTKQ